jgi:hypothetical protein
VRIILYISPIFLMLIGLVSCCKDKISSSTSDEMECSEFQNLPSIIFFSNDRIQFQTPYFNPNNSSEFIFNYRDYSLNEYKLIKFNIQTGIQTELANNVKIISQPKWSRKGWIAFDNVYNANYQIWVVKENGDSLNQMSIDGGNVFPVWDSSGENLFWQHSPYSPTGHPFYLFKQGLYNLFPDTILTTNNVNSGYSGYNDISIDNQLISKTYIGNKNHIGYAEINNLSFTSLIDLEESNLIGLTGLCWSNNSQLAYFTVSKFGLFKLNIKNGNYFKLISFCDSKRYKCISCSSDGSKLIGERITSYVVKDSKGKPTGQIIENSCIYLIDLQTLKETKINLD